jgi:hypothetical protein
LGALAVVFLKSLHAQMKRLEKKVELEKIVLAALPELSAPSKIARCWALVTPWRWEKCLVQLGLINHKKHGGQCSRHILKYYALPETQ